MSEGKTYARVRRGGRFFGRRVNCEQVPLLPAPAVSRVLDDPRKMPYLFVWKSPRNGNVQEAVRLSREAGRATAFEWTDWIEIKRIGGECTYVCTVECPLPRNAGKVRLLLCPGCQQPHRALYGWRPGGRYTTSAERSPHWECRTCAGLLYASEGGALVIRTRSAMLRPLSGRWSSPRPEPWFPYVFSSPAEAAAAGSCSFSGFAP
jgi:hypothetical protein